MSKFKNVGIITLLTALLVTNTANAAVIGNVTKSQKSKKVKVSLSAKTISVGKSAKIKISFPAKAKKKASCSSQKKSKSIACLAENMQAEHTEKKMAAKKPQRHA